MIREAITNISEGKDRSWQIINMINEGHYIPLGAKMMERLNPTEKMYYFHTSHINDLSNVKRLEKSRKQISAFTEWSGFDIFRGPDGNEHDEPIISVLYGNYSINFSWDLWTIRDNDGKRWINVREFLSNNNPEEIKDIFIKITELIEEAMRKKYPEVVTMFPSNVDKEDKETRTLRYNYIKYYYDVSEKIFGKYINEIKDLIKSKTLGTSHYNEVIGYNYVIKEVLVREENYNDFRNTVWVDTKLEATFVDSNQMTEKILNKYKRKNKS